MPGFDTIVVAVDFSETSTEAFEAACQLAECFGSRIHLFHASPDPLQEACAVESFGMTYREIGHAWRAQAESRLSAMEPSRPIPEHRITRAVEMGLPEQAIIAYATRHDADLIVMGTNGYSAFTLFQLGSVAEHVVREAPCAVITVPHHERREAMAGSMESVLVSARR
jgi:nucleotide-binding universal stress UspA family protein